MAAGYRRAERGTAVSGMADSHFREYDSDFAAASGTSPVECWFGRRRQR
jgi:hypothetical protein